jgi:hypothetical protein
MTTGIDEETRTRIEDLPGDHGVLRVLLREEQPLRPSPMRVRIPDTVKGAIPRLSATLGQGKQPTQRGNRLDATLVGAQRLTMRNRRAIQQAQLALSARP